MTSIFGVDLKGLVDGICIATGGMGPPTLYIYVIHAQALTQRAIRIHGVIQELRTSAIAHGFEVRPILVISKDAPEIAEKLADYQGCVNYDPVGDADFDNLRQVLSTEIISNIEKHKEAWKRIYENTASHNPDDLFMVLEDDAFLLPDGPKHFEELLANAGRNTWDVLFLGISSPSVDKDAGISLIPVKHVVGKVLPGKESYFIKQQTAKTLHDMMATIRFPLRIQLSHIFHTHLEIRVLHPNKHILLDGSKMGFVPSTIHANNLLVFNREYMEMLKYMSHPPNEMQKELTEIRALYKKIQHMNSPDVMHLYGVLLFKCGKVMDAEEMLQNAMKEMHAQQGILNSRSDLMNNLIMVYQHMQRDLPELLGTASIYDNPAAAVADIHQAC